MSDWVIISIFIIVLILFLKEIGGYLFYTERIEKSLYWGIVTFIIGIIFFLISILWERKQILEFIRSYNGGIALSLLTIILFFLSVALEIKCSLLKKKTIALEEKEICDKLKTLGLTKIEEYLKKDDEKYREPHFFRWQGSLWIDFEKGYVVEREEVDKIIKELEKEQVFLTGEPASGKSTVLRMVGYKLAKSKKNVFILPFKEISRVEKRDEIVENLQKINGYLFIDDVHLNKEDSEYFLRNIKERVLFSGRKPKEKEEERIAEIDRRLISGIEVKPDENIKEKIVNRFIEITKCEVSEEIKNSLLEMGNLMLLSLQLEVHMDDKGKEIKELKPITEKVKKYIEEVKKRVISAEDIFLPVALFYQFELPIRKNFLEDELSISEENILELAEKEREVLLLEKNGCRYLALYHSEVAKIFIECYKEFEDFGNSIKNKLKFNSYNWEIGCFWKYLNKYPEEGNYVISRISYDIFIKMSQLKKFPFLLKEIFEKAEYFDNFCLLSYGGLPEDKLNEVQKISVEIFAKKIKEWKNPWHIAYLLRTLKKIEYQKINELLNMLKPEMLASKIKEWKVKIGDEELTKISIKIFLNFFQELNYPYLDELKELIK